MTNKATGVGRLVTVAVAAVGLCAVAIPLNSAHAQLLGPIYLGWDFGNGFGIGIGQVPSAYNPCPTYGWPFYPHNCAVPASAPVVR